MLEGILGVVLGVGRMDRAAARQAPIRLSAWPWPTSAKAWEVGIGDTRGIRGSSKEGLVFVPDVKKVACAYRVSRWANSAGLTIFVPPNSGKGKCFLLPVTR